MEKSFDDVKKFSEMVAHHKGWILNPDNDFYISLLEGLNQNFNKYSYFLCPCREAWGIKEKDSDIICPCRYAKDDIEEFGHCYCALYLSEDFIKSGKEPSSIPERRSKELFPK